MEPERWTEIERLFHAALELEDGSRAAFLEEICGADEELRREVESLLASGAATGDFIEAPAMEVAAKALARNPSRLSRDCVKPGDTVAHYQILEKAGAGGMGEVYRARDTTLGREVALKFLPEAPVNDQDRMARFQREAKILASLNVGGRTLTDSRLIDVRGFQDHDLMIFISPAEQRPTKVSDYWSVDISLASTVCPDLKVESIACFFTGTASSWRARRSGMPDVTFTPAAVEQPILSKPPLQGDWQFFAPITADASPEFHIEFRLTCS